MTDYRPFARCLSPAKQAALERLAGAAGNNWFKDLLAHWTPSGKPPGDDGLRLALRDGELHFYRHGRRIARVCFGPERQRVVAARMEIHERYTGGAGDRSLKFDDTPGSYPGREALARWIATRGKKNEIEKPGVDEIVGANPGVIDLEVGIPGHSEGDPPWTSSRWRLGRPAPGSSSGK